jgi:hypothetical protein
LVTDGVLQLGGVAMFVAGFAYPKTELVRDRAFDLRPVVSSQRAGLEASGTF